MDARKRSRFIPLKEDFKGIEAQGHERALENFRKAFEASEGKDRARLLFFAMIYCGDNSLALPAWASTAFKRAITAWEDLRVPSLDAAFSITPTKHWKSKRLRRDILPALVAELHARQVEGRPRDWKAMASKIGCSHKLLEQLWRQSSALQAAFPPKFKNRG